MPQKTKILLDLPISLVTKIRLMSANRKASQHPNNTQKSIYIELIENGLVVTDDTPTLTPSHEALTQPQEKEINNTLSLPF
jgi:hypothetical protein